MITRSNVAAQLQRCAAAVDAQYAALCSAAHSSSTDNQPEAALTALEHRAGAMHEGLRQLTRQNVIC